MYALRLTVLAATCAMALSAPFVLAETPKTGGQPAIKSVPQKSGAQPVIKSAPKVNSIFRFRQRIDSKRLELLHQMHLARAAAKVAKVVDELREGAVGKLPNPTDHGDLTDRSTGRAGDRLGGARPPGPSSPYEDPLDRYSSGINDRIHKRPPRSTVVGPGNIPTDPTGLVSLSKTESEYDNGVHTDTTTFRHDRTGATFLIYTVSYDIESGRLLGWSATVVDEFGDSRTQSNRVEYRGPNQDVPVVITTVHSNDDAELSTVTRPIQPTDPPVHDPNPTLPIAEEGTPVKLPTMPWGIQCNAITGVCTEGMKIGNDLVNPGPEQQNTNSGSTLRIDPHGLVVNPNPVDAPVQGSRRPIDRDGGTPGGRPPPEPTGND